MSLRIGPPCAAIVVIVAIPSLPLASVLAQVLQPGQTGGPQGNAPPSNLAPTTMPSSLPSLDQLKGMMGAQGPGAAGALPGAAGAPGGAAVVPQGPVGGGNVTSSSSRPVTGNERDSFDLGPKNGAGGTVRGSEKGPIFSGDEPRRAIGMPPGSHVVRKGDTLWEICDQYFKNPYQWPRIWSFNPEIKNPHWIYPGDQLRLREGATLAMQANGGPPQSTTLGGIIDRRRRVVPDTIFLRDEGYIEDKSDQDWGELTGSPEDKMFLSDGDNAYVHIAPGHEVKLGQELSIFRPVRSARDGKVVQIQGTLRINQWNPSERIARGHLVESLDVIERGARVGPIGRRFEVIAPARNDTDVKAHIITSVRPFNFYGQNQVVFIDKGAEDGLKVGNRLFVMRKGDAWRQSLATPGAGQRISPEAENLPDMENTPGARDQKHYPSEVIGELRVLATKAHTATCLVTEATTEIERDDELVARKGY